MGLNRPSSATDLSLARNDEFVRPAGAALRWACREGPVWALCDFEASWAHWWEVGLIRLLGQKVLRRSEWPGERGPKRGHRKGSDSVAGAVGLVAAGHGIACCLPCFPATREVENLRVVEAGNLLSRLGQDH